MLLSEWGKRLVLACMCAGVAQVGAVAACSSVRIDPAGSDGFKNQAACGSDKLSVKRGQIILQSGGYLELTEIGTPPLGRVRCEAGGEQKLVLNVRDGASWSERLAASQCHWLNGKLACPGDPATCVVETLQPVRQQVAVYATVQVRAVDDRKAEDERRIQLWLEGQHGALEFCRQRAGAVWPLEIPLRLGPNGAVTLDEGATTPTPARGLGQCISQQLSRRNPPDVGAGYSVLWRIERP